MVERAPNAWDRFYRFHAAPWRGERVLAPFEDVLAGRVLELGVGNGKTLRPLRERGLDVVGLDVSFHALSRLGHGILANAAALPFRDGCFDVVLDLHCTGHLPAAGRRAAHFEQARVLAPGGHVVVERLHPDDLRATNGTEIEPDTRQLADGRTTHFSDETALRADLEAAGFEVLRSDTTRRTPKLRGDVVTRASVLAIARR